MMYDGGIFGEIFKAVKSCADLFATFKKNAAYCRLCGRKFKYIKTPFEGDDYDKSLCVSCNRAKRECVMTIAQKRYQDELSGKKITVWDMLGDLVDYWTGRDREYEKMHPVIDKVKCQGAIAQLPMGLPVLIDGSNVMRYAGRCDPCLLEACVTVLKNIGFYSIVICDANIEHIVREMGTPRSMSIFNALRSELGNDFVIVPSGQCADDIILQVADKGGNHIISNDQYRQFTHRYAWISDELRIHKFTNVDNQLVIADLNICTKLN